jgi:hypothetical protein
METPTKRPTMPNTDAPRKKLRSEVDMFHLVASMSTDDVLVTTPSKRTTLPEPNAPERPCSKAVRQFSVGKNRPKFDTNKFFV